jgi:hypothetical protein
LVVAKRLRTPRRDEAAHGTNQLAGTAYLTAYPTA